MKKPQQIFSCILLLLLAVLLLCGCARRTHQAAGAASGKIVLNFWNGFTGPDGRAMEAMVDRFRKQHPNIEVRMQIIPWGTYYDKLTLSLAYGGSPDVFVVHAGRLPEFAVFDTLRPLQDLYETTKLRLTAKDFAPVPWQATFFKKLQYALPLDVHPIGLCYNTKLFKEASIVDEMASPK